MEESEKTEIKQDKRLTMPHLYKKGQSGNPNGRPKGSRSLKSYIKAKFAAMTDEEFEEYLDGIDKHKIWEMAEDKAGQAMEVTGSLTISDVLNNLEHGQSPQGQTMENESPIQN